MIICCCFALDTGLLFKKKIFWYVLFFLLLWAVCLSHNHCDLQPWARAVCTFLAVPRSTQPSTLRETVNEYQLSG